MAMMSNVHEVQTVLSRSSGPLHKLGWRSRLGRVLVSGLLGCRGDSTLVKLARSTEKEEEEGFYSTKSRPFHALH